MVSRILNQNGYNIARLALERKKKGGSAMTICEVDEIVREEVVQEVKHTMPGLQEIRFVQTI